jgi:hypothetical protein
MSEARISVPVLPSAPRCPEKAELSDSPTSANSYDSFNGQSPCMSTSPSSDNLQGYTTPNGTWDGQSTRVNSLRSPGGSSTYLVSRHLDGVETPATDTGASTPTFDRKHPVRSLCHTIHERMHPEPPYHVLPLAKKKTLMYIAAISGMFSSLSANIYFPALGQISRVSKSLIYAIYFLITLT